MTLSLSHSWCIFSFLSPVFNYSRTVAMTRWPLTGWWMEIELLLLLEYTSWTTTTFVQKCTGCPLYFDLSLSNQCAQTYIHTSFIINVSTNVIVLMNLQIFLAFACAYVCLLTCLPSMIIIIRLVSVASRVTNQTNRVLVVK